MLRKAVYVNDMEEQRKKANEDNEKMNEYD